MLTKNLTNTIEQFNIGDAISIFCLREENLVEELYFIGIVTQKNLQKLTFNICAHHQIEMKFNFLSPFIVQINLLKKNAINFLQFKKKKKKIYKILKKKKNNKKFKFFNLNLKNKNNFKNNQNNK